MKEGMTTKIFRALFSHCGKGFNLFKHGIYKIQCNENIKNLSNLQGIMKSSWLD